MVRRFVLMDIKRLIKGSRTHTYNALMYVINGGFFTFLMTVNWETAGFTPQHAIWVMVALNVVDRVMIPALRNMTTGPVDA